MTTLTRTLASRQRHAVRALMLALLALFAAYAARAVAADHLHAAGWLRKWGDTPVIAIAVALTLLRAAWVRAERFAWLAIAAGMLSWGAANVYWTAKIGPLGDAAPYPSIADVFFLLLYPLVYVGIVLLIRARVERFHGSVWLDGLIGALGVSALGAAIVFQAVLDATGGGLGTAATATNMAYPLGDGLMLALVAFVCALAGWRPGRAWLLLLLGFMMLGVADSLFLYLTSAGGYEPGTAVSALFPAGMALLALASWQRAERDAPIHLEGWPVLVLPQLFTLGALAVLVYGSFHADLNSLALALAAGTVLAAMLRTALTFREVRKLPETRRQAKTDELTELGNRRFIYERLEQEIAAAVISGARFSLALFDLDRFKELNDTLGHDAGDELLRMVGPRIRSVLRRADPIARIGGDEFAVILTEESTIAGAVDVTNRIRAALEEPFTLNGIHVHVGASVGLTIYPDHGTDHQELLKRADTALYLAKAERTGHAVYDASRDPHSVERLALIADMRSTSQGGELVVHFQPQAELASGEITGAEALVRWQHPTRGLLYPDEFLQMAEQTGLMRPLTMRVLNSALEQCAQWRAEGRTLRVAVNLSAANLIDVQLPHDVRDLLIRHAVPAELLQLEITEDTVSSDPVRAEQVLAELKQLGVTIALDDYGTGYSSLAHLRRLAVDVLKIDRSFVMNMGSVADDAVIVRSTIELGHNLGLRVVAEGVEDQAAWDSLAAWGCDLAQGYLLAKPLPAAELTARLSGGRLLRARALRP